jgi:hypothetical protein
VITVDGIDEGFVPAVRPDVGVVEADGEAVVVTVTGEVHRLNPTAAVVWSCCDGTGPLGELVDELSEAYGVDRGVIADDVVAIVREFGRAGLLDGVEPPPPGPDDEAAAPPSNGDEGACPEPTATEPVESDVPLPRYLIVPPSS